MPIQTINALDLLISQTCNLSCIYCYCNEGEFLEAGLMTADVAKASVDWLIRHSGGVKKLYISFFGGEPLVNFQVLQDTVLYSRAKERQETKEFYFSMVTNGIAITPEVEKFLHDQHVSMTISIDGPAEIQDSQRPDRAGNGTFERVMKNVKRIAEKKDAKIPHSNSVYLQPNPFSPLEIKNFLEGQGFPYANFHTASNTFLERELGKTDTDHTVLFPIADADKLRVSKLIQERNSSGLRSYAASMVFQHLMRLVSNQTKKNGCRAGRSYFAVDINGDLYLCHSLVGFDKYKVGNIKDPDFTQNPIYECASYPEQCQTCEANILCAGGCYYENALENGDLFAPLEDKCSYMKYTASQSMDLFNTLDDASKEFLLTLPKGRSE